MKITAKLIIDAAQKRTESIGAHYRSDTINTAKDITTQKEHNYDEILA